jgi:hypothetical protein
MIDLPVNQYDGPDPGIAHALVWLQRGVLSDLLVNVGRGVAHDPLAAVDRDGYRRLAAPAGIESTGAHAAAITTVAIPLWKAPTGSRT